MTPEPPTPAPTPAPPPAPTPEQRYYQEQAARRRRAWALCMLALSALLIWAGAALGGALAIAAFDGHLGRFRSAFVNGVALGMLGALPGLFVGVYLARREFERGEMFGRSADLRVRGFLSWLTFLPTLLVATAAMSYGATTAEQFNFVVAFAALAVGVFNWFAATRLFLRLLP